jgi:uncharacterized protein YidB (DUF937 family)
MKETDMGLLDGMIGGVVAGVVNNVLERHGGLPGVVSAFERQGFGATVQSWVGKGENLPISAEQVQQVLGADLIQQMAARTGMPVAELTQKLAQILPQEIDKMTPGGVIPG